MKRKRIIPTLLFTFALTVMSSITTFAFTNMDYAFSFPTSNATHYEYSDPNLKEDLEEYAYVTVTNINTDAPITFVVFRTNFYTMPVTYGYRTSTTMKSHKLQYTEGPYEGIWYQLAAYTSGVTGSASGRWCP